MATRKQIEANRTNAQLSTGPKTEEGKQRSAHNAVKHGMHASDFCLNHEDQESYRNFHSQLLYDWDPKSGAELILIEQLLRAHFLSRRYASYLQDLHLGDVRGGTSVLATYPVMQKLINQVDRTVQRCITQLREIQQDRAKAANAIDNTKHVSTTKVVPTHGRHEEEPLLNLPDPPDLNDLNDFGFVPPTTTSFPTTP